MKRLLLFLAFVFPSVFGYSQSKNLDIHNTIGHDYEEVVEVIRKIDGIHDLKIDNNGRIPWDGLEQMPRIAYKHKDSGIEVNAIFNNGVCALLLIVFNEKPNYSLVLGSIKEGYQSMKDNRWIGRDNYGVIIWEDISKEEESFYGLIAKLYIPKNEK